MNTQLRTTNGTFWSKDGKHWFCRSHTHLQTKQYRPDCGQCNYAKCPGVRPPVPGIALAVGNIAGIRKLELYPAAIKELEEKKKAFQDPELGTAWCAWGPCTNDRRTQSKYCSRACSNKNARARHAARK